MSENIWIAIITICMSAIIAWSAAWWQVRVARAIANPEQNQLNPVIKDLLKIGGFLLLIIIFCILGSIIPVYQIFFSVDESQPVTRTDVFFISWSVGLLFCNVIFMSKVFIEVVKKDFNPLWKEFKSDKRKT